MPAETQPLPSVDEHSDEDSLVGGTRPPSAGLALDPELMDLLRPRGLVTQGSGRKPIGLGDRRVFCAASVSDAVIEDRG